jgi:dTDP-4-amino-4,6-dideoxygalactose transaminase
LIPRYNWDFGLSDLVVALSAVLKPGSRAAPALAARFGQEPILTCSGRTSLYVLLKALDLAPGSSVGVPLFCCPVVFEAIRQAGLTPAFLDIELHDYNLSPSDLQEKAGGLSALVVVHMFGNPAGMDRISGVAGGIPVVEDCAQSLFSRYKSEYTGFLSTASFFSFRSGKYLSAGEGSAIFCNDPALGESVKAYARTLDQPGSAQTVFHSVATYLKSCLYRRPWYGTIGLPVGKHLDRKLNLTAKSGFDLRGIWAGDLGVIDGRMTSFPSLIDRQRRNSQYLQSKIELKNVFLPRENKECTSNWYQFALRFENTEARDRMADHLFRCGVDAAKYLDEVVEVARAEYGYQGDCPKAELASKTVLVIPNYYTLSQKDLDHIAQSLNEGQQCLIH